VPKNRWSTAKIVVVAVVILVVLVSIYAVAWFFNTARPS
jgi:uncharacterized membrane protein YukC